MDEPRQNPPLWEFPLFPPPVGASISWNEVLVSLLPRGLEGLNLLLQILGIFGGIFGEKTSQGDVNARSWVGKIHARVFPRKRIRAWDWETFPAPDHILGCFPEFYFPTNFFPYKETNPNPNWICWEGKMSLEEANPRSRHGIFMVLLLRKNRKERAEKRRNFLVHPFKSKSHFSSCLGRSREEIFLHGNRISKGIFHKNIPGEGGS